MYKDDKKCESKNHKAENVERVILIRANGGRFAKEESFDQPTFFYIFLDLVFK